MKQVLTFFNLLDSAGNLSITNVAVIIAVTKMAFMSQFSGVDAIGLVSTLLNYAHKRMVNSDEKS